MLRDPRRHSCRGVHYKRRAFGLVRWRSAIIRLFRLCYHSLPMAAAGAVKARAGDNGE